MSSVAEDQRQSSPQSNLPPSAQPFRSLFGGDHNSQDVDLQPYPEGQQDEDAGDENDLDVIMRDIPLMDDNQSDATYHASDEDESEPVRRNEVVETENGVKKRRRPGVGDNVSTTRARDESDSPPSSPNFRPNRFRGPESSWRKLTTEERQNAQALEAIRARDLAAHLYNAYALRVRACERGTDKQEYDYDAFVAPKRWTAWPMRSDQVPRPDERLRREEDDAWSLRMPPDPRPSAHLEDCITAILMKVAKEKVGTREWDNRRSKSQPRRRAESEFNSHDDSAGNEENWDSDEELSDDADLIPMVQADDDKSKKQLRPIVRNVLTQFDKLLMGLHHARSGGMAEDSSASEQSDTESIASSMSPVKREVSRSRSRGRTRTRVSLRPSSLDRESDTSNKSQETERSHGRSLGRQRESSANRLREGLRDWSEVMGVASMVGCPPAAVMRASKRCANLFGEDMEFQSFHEGTMETVKEEDGTEILQYVEPEPEAESSPSPAPPSRRSTSTKPRSRATSVKRESTSRPVTPAPETGAQVPPPKGKGQHRKQDLVCPMKKCPRHFDGFTRTWNLNLHMKRMHPGFRQRSASSGAPIKTDGEDNMSDKQ